MKSFPRFQPRTPNDLLLSSSSIPSSYQQHHHHHHSVVDIPIIILVEQKSKGITQEFKVFCSHDDVVWWEQLVVH